MDNKYPWKEPVNQPFRGCLRQSIRAVYPKQKAKVCIKSWIETLLYSAAFAQQ